MSHTSLPEQNPDRPVGNWKPQQFWYVQEYWKHVVINSKERLCSNAVLQHQGKWK